MDAISCYNSKAGAYDDCPFVVATSGKATLYGFSFAAHDTAATVIAYDMASKTTADTTKILFSAALGSVTSLLPNIEVKYGLYIVMTGANSKLTIHSNRELW